jgi:hypothetical protein
MGIRSRVGQATIDRPIELNELDGDMTASDVIAILQQLHFGTGYITIQIDRDARDACKLGCEAIVSKRLGSPYRFGRSAQWPRVKNPKAPAVKREAEEDGGRRSAGW